MELKLYEYYTQDEIFDSVEQLKATKAKGWYASARSIVGIFEIGERPPKIHFCDDSRFHWYSQLKKDRTPEVLKEFSKQRDGYLFIKSPRNDRYMYIANIEHVGMYGEGKDGHEASMTVAPRVPTELLHELGGLFIHSDCQDAMNEPVEMLRQAQTASDRFKALQSFVERWRGPVDADFSISKEDIDQSPVAVPRILRKLYQWAGACEDVMQAGYLSIRKPEELSADDYGYVPFCVECQWCGNYYIKENAMQDEDPEVFADECGETREGKGYHGTGIGLSKFLWAYYIAFNLGSGPISYEVEFEGDEFRRLKSEIKALPILASGSRSCRAIQAYNPEIRKDDEAMIFAQDGVMGCLVCSDHFRSIIMMSKTQKAIDAFISSLKIDPSRLGDPV
ncbi:MAG: hypothetical protein AAF483_07000 [Planctomycetota bacterium]